MHAALPRARARYTLAAARQSHPSWFTDATGAEPVSIEDPARRPGPTRSARSSRACLWHLDQRPTATWWHAWYPGCRRRYGVEKSARWVLDRYGVRFPHRTQRPAITTSGCPFHKPVHDMTGLSQAIRRADGLPVHQRPAVPAHNCRRFADPGSRCTRLCLAAPVWGHVS